MADTKIVNPHGTPLEVRTSMIQFMTCTGGNSDKYYAIVEVPVDGGSIWLSGYGRNGHEGTWNVVDRKHAEKKTREAPKKGYRTMRMSRFDRDNLERNVHRLKGIGDWTTTTEEVEGRRFALTLSRVAKGAPAPKVVREDPREWAGDW